MSETEQTDDATGEAMDDAVTPVVEREALIEAKSEHQTTLENTVEQLQSIQQQMLEDELFSAIQQLQQLITECTVVHADLEQDCKQLRSEEEHTDAGVQDD